MAIRFICDNKQPAVRALGEVAKKSAHVGITRRTDGRAWASVTSPDRAVLLEVRLADAYPDGAPDGGFVVTLGELGDKPIARSWPRPWNLGVDDIVSALYEGVADGSTTEVRIDETTRREMVRAVSHAAKPDDRRLHLQGVWALESGGACAADGHRAVVPRHVYDGKGDKAAVWLPAPLVHVIGRVARSEIRVLVPPAPKGRAFDDQGVWCAAEWDGGRAAFLADDLYIFECPALNPHVVVPGQGYHRAHLDGKPGREIAVVRYAIEKTKEDHVRVHVTREGDLYLGLPGQPERNLFGDLASVYAPDLVHVNPRYLADALRAVGDVREVAMAAPSSPIYIAGNDRACVVMPIRK